MKMIPISQKPIKDHGVPRDNLKIEDAPLSHLNNGLNKRETSKKKPISKHRYRFKKKHYFT